MYFFLIWSFNFPQEMDKTGSNRFCNMLMYALSKVLQHADVCYNLPPGFWIFYDSKVKEKYKVWSLFSVYNVFVICGALDEENDDKLDRFLKWNPLRGISWSPLLKTYKSSSHPQPGTHTPCVLTLSHTCTHNHPYLQQIQPTQLISLKVNLPYNHHPSSKPAIPNSQALPHMPTQWNKIPVFISSIFPIHPKFQFLTFFNCPPFVPTKTREWFL